MVFFVRETLTEEDRAAYQHLRDQRDREARRKRRRNTLDWLGGNLSGFLCVMMGIVMLYAIVSGGVSAWYLLDIPFMLAGGVVTLVMRRHFPAGEMNLLPGEKFPPSDIVRAVFFEDGCFAFWNTSGKARLGYSSIHGAWEDKERFYLFFQDRPPLVLPKRGFAGCGPEDFRDFLERELDCLVERGKQL